MCIPALKENEEKEKGQKILLKCVDDKASVKEAF